MPRRTGPPPFSTTSTPLAVIASIPLSIRWTRPFSFRYQIWNRMWVSGQPSRRSRSTSPMPGRSASARRAVYRIASSDARMCRSVSTSLSALSWSNTRQARCGALGVLHVVARPQLRIGEHVEGLDQLPEPVRVAALRIVRMVALGQVSEDTLDGVLIGVGGNLEGFVVVAGERIGHGS